MKLSARAVIVAGVGKFATLAPASMADDETALRAHVTMMARAQGCTVSEAAALTVRVITGVLDSEVRATHVEIETD